MDLGAARSGHGEVLHLPLVGERARDIGLDALKGVTILLVVLSHALQGHPAAGGPAIWTVMWYVDMPLFVMLSGFASGYARERTFLQQAKRRALQLLVPYAAWGVLLYLLSGSVTAAGLGRAVLLTAIGQAGPWFLLALFVFDVLLLAFRRLTARPVWLLALCLSAMVAAAAVRAISGPWLDEAYRTVFDIQKYLLFYVIGFLACRHRGEWGRYALPVTVAALVAFPAGLAYKHLGGEALLGGALTAAGIPLRSVIAWGVGYATQTVVSLSACVLAFRAVRLVDPRRLRAAAFVGSLSLGVYLLHIPLRPVLHGSGWMWVILTFAMSVSVSLAASFLISRVPVVNVVLLGGRSVNTGRGAIMAGPRDDTEPTTGMPSDGEAEIDAVEEPDTSIG